MKKLTVILFADALEHKQYAGVVCDKFLVLPEKSEFLGTWWIEYNQEECTTTISVTANHFIDNTDKTEIIFGISSKDYEDVISKINVEKCIIERVDCKEL